MSEKYCTDDANDIDGEFCCAYTPLSHALERDAHDYRERKEIAIEYLPTILTLSFHEHECLQDVINVGDRYPELVPEILTCALNLRRKYSEKTDYEMQEYKDFITGLEQKVLSQYFKDKPVQ
jgi:hypothetical protein